MYILITILCIEQTTSQHQALVQCNVNQAYIHSLNAEDLVKYKVSEQRSYSYIIMQC